jgi:hypothetical protein
MKKITITNIRTFKILLHQQLMEKIDLYIDYNLYFLIEDSINNNIFYRKLF